MILDPIVTNEVLVMAKTIWGEARGDGTQGMTAVACVIMNRVNNPSWWGDTVTQVCLQPYQFSCWNIGDPNRAKMENLTAEDSNYLTAIGIAVMIMSKKIRDITDNADSYFDLSMSTPPSWAADAVRTVTIGSQAFYRVQLHPLAAQGA